MGLFSSKKRDKAREQRRKDNFKPEATHGVHDWVISSYVFKGTAAECTQYISDYNKESTCRTLKVFKLK